MEGYSRSLLFRASGNHVGLASRLSLPPRYLPDHPAPPVQPGPQGLQAVRGSPGEGFYTGIQWTLHSTDPPFSLIIPPLSPSALTPEKESAPTHLPGVQPCLSLSLGSPQSQNSLTLHFPQPFIPLPHLLQRWPHDLCTSESSGSPQPYPLDPS